jgi:hypothetical protein
VYSSHSEDCDFIRSLQCLAEATTAQPPEGILSPQNNGASNRADRSSVVRAVSIAPSLHRHYNGSGASIGVPSFEEGYETSIASFASSGVYGPGYYSGKAIKWLGEISLKALEEVIILRRAHQHRTLLKRWRKLDRTEIEREEQQKVLQIVEEALEMSRYVQYMYPDAMT